MAAVTTAPTLPDWSPFLAVVLAQGLKERSALFARGLPPTADPRIRLVPFGAYLAKAASVG